MIDYIKGQIVELTPTELILENAGIGYSILISLQTFEAFQSKTHSVAYIHHYIREDEELYYGFATKDGLICSSLSLHYLVLKLQNKPLGALKANTLYALNSIDILCKDGLAYLF